MKIIVPSSGLQQNSSSGGERYSCQLVQALCQLGDDVHVLLAPSQPHPSEITPEPTWPRKGQHWWVTPWSLQPAIARCVRTHHPDLLVSHSLLYTGLSCVVAKRKYGLPFVAHLHHLEPARNRIERWVMREADLVIADSKFAKRQAVEAGIDGGKIRMVYCGTPDPLPQSPTLWNLESKRVVLSIGPCIERKRPIKLVERFAPVADQFPDAVLVWVGAGPLMADAVRTAARLGIGDQIRFVGHVSESVKQALLSQATVYATTSRLEGFPLAVLEAMSYGLPVVAYRAASMEELVLHGDTGFLADTDQDFSTALSLFLSGKASGMGFRGQERIHKYFQWSYTVEGVRTVYQEALGHS